MTRFFYPRPEYPRPDRQRGTVEGYDWLNLNGPWQFRFDGSRLGIEEKWFSPGAPDWREQIIVPFCWESLAAWGEGDSAGSDNYYSTHVFRNPVEVTRANHRSAPRYEVGWYRRAVEIPRTEPWKGKRIILTIGAADFFTDCWCNGVHLGHHEGGYTPFEFDLTDCCSMNELHHRHIAEIVLRVEDPMDNAEQPVGKQWRWYTTTSGIWQTLFIEPRSATYIQTFRFITDIETGTVRLQCRAGVPPAQAPTARLQVEITSPDGRTQNDSLDVGNGTAEQSIKLKSRILWEPNNPNLYNVLLRLCRGSKALDTVRTYFGLRKADFELAHDSGVPTALRINGSPRYLRGALYQSYYPEGVYTAASVETLKNDILSARQFGFNFLRIHIKVDDPLLLYWADKLGMLLMADFPNFGEGGDTPLGRQRFETMVRETIERDFNHPSIFAWCLFNETWGFGGQTTFADILRAPEQSRDREGASIPAASAAERSAGFQPAVSQVSNLLTAQAATQHPPEQHISSSIIHHPSSTTPSPAHPLTHSPAQTSTLDPQPSSLAPRPSPLAPQHWVQQMWELAKQLDPTRLVEDMSVCHWEHLEYYLHCDTDINSWHFYINDYQKAKAHIDKVVSSTFVGSSFNYVPGFLHKGQPLINSEYGGIGALDGDRDMSWSFKFLTNELRRHQQVAAYIYTELHDVEWEYNGFLNYDRTPKEFGYDARLINESNVLPIDSPPIQRLPPGQMVQLKVDSAHFSTRRYENVSLHWALAGIDTRGRFHQDLACGRAPIPFPHRQVAHAHTIEFRLPDMPMLCTLLISARTADGTTIAGNYVQYLASAAYPPEREEIPRALVLRSLPGKWAHGDWSDGFSDRDKACAEDCCWGSGHGFFEWSFPLPAADLAKARRIRLLCEASSHRSDCPQTDGQVFPTTLQMLLNDVCLYKAVLRNHSHDSRGALSYLRGGVGAYGYLAHTIAENDLIHQIAANSANDSLRLRCAVSADALAQGGLTIYGAECGRFPVCPTVIVEW